MEGNSDSRNNYSENNIVDMLDFLVDNIFVVFFRRQVGENYSQQLQHK